MKARLEIDGCFFKYMEIDLPIQEIRYPIPTIPNYSTDVSRAVSFVELIFNDAGYSEIDGFRLYKLRGALV